MGKPVPNKTTQRAGRQPPNKQSFQSNSKFKKNLKRGPAWFYPGKAGKNHAKSPATAIKILDSYASKYCKCSNIAFSQFLNHFQASSVIHKEMLAILSAVVSVIKENKGKESSSEYYSALMTTLDQAETDQSILAILSLLGMLLNTVPKNILQSQFNQASLTFVGILKKYSTKPDSHLVIRHCIECLEVLLQAQDSDTLNNNSTITIFDEILLFAVHTKPKIRKAAQHAISLIFKDLNTAKTKTDESEVSHPAVLQVANYCLSILKNSQKLETTEIDSTKILHMLAFLKDIIHFLPIKIVKLIADELLQILEKNDVMLTSCCLQILYSLFSSQTLAWTNQMKNAIEAAIIKLLGLKLVVSKKQASDFNHHRIWLLNVLKNSVNESKLSHFRDTILPLVVMSDNKPTELEPKNDQVSDNTYDANKLENLYDSCVLMINDNQNSEDQQKGYKTLEEILSNESEIFLAFVKENRKKIQKMVVDATENMIITSKENRLYCLRCLIKNHPKLQKTKFLKSIIPEIVMYLKEFNETCRVISYELLNEIADKLKTNTEFFGDYIDMLIAGFGGDPNYVAASLLGLAGIIFKHHSLINDDKLKEIITFSSSLLAGSSKEINTAVLGLFKVFTTSLSTCSLRPLLTIIINGFTSMTDNCKRHFRRKISDILLKLVKNFDFKTISKMVPASDGLTQKRLVNIEKKEVIKLDNKNKNCLSDKNMENSSSITGKKRKRNTNDDDDDENKMVGSKKKGFKPLRRSTLHKEKKLKNLKGKHKNNNSGMKKGAGSKGKQK